MAAASEARAIHHLRHRALRTPVDRPRRPRIPARDPERATAGRLAGGRLRPDVQRQERGDDPPAAPRGDRRAAGRDLQAAHRRQIRRRGRRQSRGRRACAASRSARWRSSTARAPGHDVVGIDEVQFFEPAIVRAALALAESGVRVVAAGLDQDFRRAAVRPDAARCSRTRSSSTSCRRSATAAAARQRRRSGSSTAGRRRTRATRS